MGSKEASWLTQGCWLEREMRDSALLLLPFLGPFGVLYELAAEASPLIAVVGQSEIWMVKYYEGRRILEGHLYMPP